MSLFDGQLGGLTLQFCPKELAGIKATESTIEPAFEVSDIEGVVKAVLSKVRLKIGDVQTRSETAQSCGVRDPDGNSIELRKKEDTKVVSRIIQEKN